MIKKLCTVIGLFALLASGFSFTPLIARAQVEFPKITPGLEFDRSFANNNLEWITSQNDSQVAKLSDDKQIEAKIKEIVTGYGAKNLREMELPFNRYYLQYLGRVHPNSLGAFSPTSKYWVNTFNLAWIDSPSYTYRYDGIYISVPENDVRNQLNVYYTIRAINLLKYRYPKAYDRLFLRTKTPPAEGDIARKRFDRFSAIYISFNQSPGSIAASFSSEFLSKEQQNLPTYDLVPIVSIHSQTILGEKESSGSRPIYQTTSIDPQPSTNYDRYYLTYMREGLVETLVHEMLHRYIDYSQSVSRRSAYVFQTLRQAGNVGGRAEENTVMNTSLSFFEKEGGLGPETATYYKVVFDRNIQAIKDANKLKEYADGVASMPYGTEYRKAFRLPILD